MKNVYKTRIRKNTESLRKSLLEMGYKISESTIKTYYDEIMCCDGIAYGCDYPYWLRNEAIDCGDNEKLFLTLSYIREDSCIGRFYYVLSSSGKPYEYIFECTGETRQNGKVVGIICERYDNKNIKCSFHIDQVKEIDIEKLIEILS